MVAFYQDMVRIVEPPVSKTGVADEFYCHDGIG